MVETYDASECRVYFVPESEYGVTPTNPAMKSIQFENIDPGINPGNIKVRGMGSRELQQIYKGLRAPSLKITHIIPPGADAIHFIQYVQTLTSLSIEVLYYKGTWASPTDIISLLYKGARIDKLTVECSLEDILKAVVDVLAQDVTVGTAKITGATYTDYAGAIPSHDAGAEIKRTAADGTNPVAITRAMDYKWTYENNLRPVGVIRTTNGHLLKYLPARHRNFYGEINFEFEEITEFSDVINDNYFGLAMKLGDSLAQATYCKWDDVAIPTRIEDLVALKAKWTAHRIHIS